MIALDKPKVFRKKRRPANIPEYLIYEIIDGKPYYRKGYRDVMNNTKTLEEIMGCSSYQWVILQYLARLLFAKLSMDDYWVAINEPGVHLDRRNNLSGDIIVLGKKDMPGSAFSVKYTAIPALLHIEVDISADLEDETSIIYLEKKINKLLSFGTKKVVWFFTKNLKVLIATDITNWQWHDLNETIPLIDSVSVNIGDYLKSEGIEIKE